VWRARLGLRPVAGRHRFPRVGADQRKATGSVCPGIWPVLLLWVIGVHLLSQGHTGHDSIFHAISQKRYSHGLDASKIS
jgi:hypothetical protein